MSKTLSYIFPARRAQWVAGALSYAYGLDNDAANEVVILATGIDQYIQQVFHHLDAKNTGIIDKVDFSVLCEILRIEDQAIIENLPSDIDFKEFHGRLVQHFMSNTQASEFSQPNHTWKQNSELINVEVDVPERNGISVRNICTECYQAKPLAEVYKSLLYKHGGNAEYEHCSSTKRNGHERMTERCKQMNRHNEALREIVEDMRLALQTSDARAIALRVALTKLQQGILPSERTVQDRTRIGQFSRLCKELEHMRLSRDQQIEEAILYSQELASDLALARRDQAETDKCRQALLASQCAMRNQLQSARDALHTALNQVKHLEQKLSTNVSSISVQTDGCDVTDLAVLSPAGCFTVSGDSNEDIERDNHGLLRHNSELPMERSVEGKADSDEESMKDWPVKSIETNNVDQTVDELKKRVFESEEKSKKIEQKFKEMESDLLTELDRRLKEMEDTDQELQKLKTEKVRQNIIETTLSQIIRMLRGIRKLGLARRIVGKMTLDTVDLCPASNPPDEEADVRNFVHLFHKQLQNVEFLPEIKETVTTCPAQVLSTRKIVNTKAALTTKTTPTKSVQIHTNFYTFSPKKQRSVEV